MRGDLNHKVGVGNRQIRVGSLRVVFVQNRSVKFNLLLSNCPRSLTMNRGKYFLLTYLSFMRGR